MSPEPTRLDSGVSAADRSAIDDLPTAFLARMPIGIAYCRMLYRDGKPHDFVYLYANAAFEAQSGMGQVGGRRASEITPNLRDTSQSTLDLFGRVAAGGPPERFDIHAGDVRQRILVQAYSPRPDHFVAILTVDDEEHLGDPAPGIYDTGGELYDLQGLLHQISERKQAERRLRISEERHRLLAENANDVVWAMSLDGKVTYVSPAVERLRGYTQAEAMRQTVDEILTPASQAVSLEYFMRLHAAIQAGLPLPTFRGEQEYRCKDGSTLWTDVMAFPLVGPDGKFVELLGVSRDLSERKRAERELQLARDAAQAASAAKTTFIANMSHEIRTPLNAILGLAQVLEQSARPGSEQQDMAQRIRDAGAVLLRTVNDVLDLSKIEAGRLDIERRPFRVADVIVHTESLTREMARSKGLALRFDAAGCDDLRLMGDAMRVEQILLNLISNSIKFTPSGEVALRITLPEASAAAVRLRFEVRDSGIGIAQDRLAGLFSRFTQAGSEITRVYGGTGLGLSICKLLVELMKGTIGAHSTEGAGSTFWFELPFERATAAEAGGGESRAPAPAPESSTGIAGLRVLVVDDSEMNLDVVERILGRNGATVARAVDGLQALQVLRARPHDFDVVLMDVQMPVLDGLAATREIRRDARLAQLPVVVLSGGVIAEEREAALDAGASDFLPKPIDLQQMRAVLGRYAGRRAPGD